MKIDDTGSQIIKDGVLDPTSIVSGANGSANSNVVNTSGELIIGNYMNSSSASLKGNIYEILFYNRTLTASEMNQVDTYLKSKWDL